MNRRRDRSGSLVRFWRFVFAPWPIGSRRAPCVSTWTKIAPRAGRRARSGSISACAGMKSCRKSSAAMKRDSFFPFHWRRLIGCCSRRTRKETRSTRLFSVAERRHGRLQLERSPALSPKRFLCRRVRGSCSLWFTGASPGSIRVSCENSFSGPFTSVPLSRWRLL